MPQFNFSDYSPQLFWLVVLFALFIAYFKYLGLPTLSRIKQDRIGLLNSQREDAEKLQQKVSELEQYYEKTVNEYLAINQQQIDKKIEELKHQHQQRCDKLSSDFHEKLKLMEVTLKENLAKVEQSNDADKLQDFLVQNLQNSIKG